MIRGERPPRRWSPGDFDLATENFEEGTEEWALALDRFEALLQIAREAAQHDGRPGGIAFYGLWRAADALANDRRNRRRAGDDDVIAVNLLECLAPNGMERRISRHVGHR
ncbi:MAG: hypothetical protein HZA93_02715 [Verrucomicrobia bacterium]|nr:hypothetical protein [Verrucomicrobiota bacterium]